MKITSYPWHLRVYVPDSLRPSMPVARALEALIHTAGGVTESAATGGWFNPDVLLSTCCGAPQGDTGFCGQCRDGCGWEPDFVTEAVTVYEWWSPTKLDVRPLVAAMLGAGQGAVMVVRGELPYPEAKSTRETAMVYEEETL